METRTPAECLTEARRLLVTGEDALLQASIRAPAVRSAHLQVVVDWCKGEGVEVAGYHDGTHILWVTSQRDQEEIKHRFLGEDREVRPNDINHGITVEVWDEMPCLTMLDLRAFNGDSHGTRELRMNPLDHHHILCDFDNYEPGKTITRGQLAYVCAPTVRRGLPELVYTMDRGERQAIGEMRAVLAGMTPQQLRIWRTPPANVPAMVRSTRIDPYNPEHARHLRATAERGGNPMELWLTPVRLSRDDGEVIWTSERLPEGEDEPGIRPNRIHHIAQRVRDIAQHRDYTFEGEYREPHE